MANVKLVYLNSTGGYPQPTSTTDVATNLGKMNLTGVAGIALDAGAAKITNLPTNPLSFTSSGDAVSKAYVDAIASGLTWLAPVSVVATSAITLSGSQTVDGNVLLNGARILVTGQNGSTPTAANGIYVVNTSGAWSRASDTLQVGSAVFVASGTTYHDTQWALSSPDQNPIVPGVTAILFSQVGASVTYSAGNGISIVGNTISAVADTAAGVSVSGSGIAVNADTSTGALQFSGGALQVSVASAGGLEISGNALQVKIADPNQLSESASGLAVEGVPALFKIDGTAVSADVTAGNLDNLTGGYNLNADTLHGHAGLNILATAGEGLAYKQLVYVNADGKVYKARADVAGTALAIGGVLDVAGIAADAVGTIRISGVMPLTGLTASEVYYLSDATAGAAVLYSALASGSRIIRLGVARSANSIVMQFQDMGVKP